MKRRGLLIELSKKNLTARLNFSASKSQLHSDREALRLRGCVRIICIQTKRPYIHTTILSAVLMSMRHRYQKV